MTTKVDSCSTKGGVESVTVHKTQNLPVSIRDEYNRLAPAYDQRWRSYIRTTLQAVIDSVRCEGHEEVLDIGCGTGELEMLLLSRWPKLRITGVDLSPGMLEQASGKDSQRKVTWLQADATSLGLPDQSFDCVICANSFHYFHRPHDVLREIRRVIRPKGRLVLVDWCDDYLICKICSLWLRWTDPAFYHTYSLRECREILNANGFQTVDARRFRAGWIWGLMCFVCQCSADSEDSLDRD